MATTALGECEFSSTSDGLVIERAAAEIQIAQGVLDLVATGEWAHGVHLDGDLLYVEGVNRRVVYKIGHQLSDQTRYASRVDNPPCRVPQPRVPAE
jgi:hypothetical protein